jgi:protein tyrosine phosphatase (PTP) superfamily phosphohydrolase (DUF442 family)
VASYPDGVTTVERQSPRRRWLKYGLSGALIAIGLVTGLKSYIGRFDGNIRVVDPGKVYRSAQLTGSGLADCLTSRHIRSVVNLQGPRTEDAALQGERVLCRGLGIQHVDIGLEADQLPRPAEMRKLLDALDSLPRPLLMHCRAGSDRSGLASAVYLVVYRGVPLDQAQSSQLTWRYGHWSFWRARAMDEFLDLYRETGRGVSLRAWIEDDYPRVYAKQERARTTR